MNYSEFNSYKKSIVGAVRQLLSQERSEALDEAAFPAYAHPNPLISFLFWHRLYRVIQHLKADAPFNHLFDFGCGSGVMLPLLSKLAGRVTAIDIDLGPLEKMRGYLNLPDNVEIFDGRRTSLSDFSPHSYDRIIALDVLEHVDNLAEVISQLCQLARPGGKIIVSGPTENIAYQIGRKIAGKDYSGDYHVTDIYKIHKVLAEFARVETLATLFYPVPLFKIYCGTV